MKHYMNWGAILGLSLVVFSIILYLFGKGESGLTSVSHLIIIGVLALAIFKVKEMNGGFLSFGEGLGTGAWISLFGAVIVAFYTFVQLSFIDPDQISRLLLKIEDQLYESQIDDSQIETVMEMYGKIFKPGLMAFFAFLGTGLEGFIVSLIASAVLKKEDTSFESNFK
ncbi:MAG: DUF4199 domain-containing protein [Flavobacteriales bacterium]|nr:DUF4199 domain-containing protein [Flavobacteriales bacterium]